MPNIGYVLDGYDVYFGNPSRTGVSGSVPDPGFRNQPIFEAKYSKGKVTPDGRFLVPDGMNIISCAGDCTMSFTSKKMSGIESYASHLDVKASVEGSGWGARFSASADYKHVASQTKNGSNLFTHSEVACCAYTASILEYSSPPFSQNFLDGLKSLKKEYDQAEYNRFIQTFGTHYIKTANMGATYGQQSEISSKSWKQMEEKEVNIGASAGYSGLFSISAKLTTDSETKKAKEFQNECTEQTLYTTGEKPPSDGNPSTWLQQTSSDPEPLSVRLASIDTLGPLKKAVSIEIIQNIKRALKDYCSQLLSDGIVSRCTPPGPDPPFPKACCHHVTVWSSNPMVINSDNILHFLGDYYKISGLRSGYPVWQKTSGPNKFMLHDSRYRGWKVSDKLNSATSSMESLETPDCPTQVNDKAKDWWQFSDGHGNWIDDNGHYLHVECFQPGRMNASASITELNP